MVTDDCSQFGVDFPVVFLSQMSPPSLSLSFFLPGFGLYKWPALGVPL